MVARLLNSAVSGWAMRTRFVRAGRAFESLLGARFLSVPAAHVLEIAGSRDGGGRRCIAISFVGCDNLAGGHWKVYCGRFCVLCGS